MIFELCIVSCLLVVGSSDEDSDFGGGAMLLQAMQTRVSSSLPTAGSGWSGAVVDEMGDALLQRLQAHPHSVQGKLPAADAPQQPKGPTPPPPAADPVWTSPLNDMPVVSHNKKPSKGELDGSNATSDSPVLSGPVEGLSPKQAVNPETQLPTAEESKEEKMEPLEEKEEEEEEDEEELSKVVKEDPGAKNITRKKIRATSPNMIRKQMREAHTGCKHGISDAEHHSIFKLTFQDLDSLLFWVIFSGMLMFTIIVDRCENVLSRLASQSKTETMLLQRINAELMMFGIVGLGVFIGTNIIADIPTEFFRVFEFTDILCSLGACGLIGIASVLFVLRRVMERRWTVLEQSLDTTRDLVLGSTTKSPDVKILADQTTLRQKEYFVMSERFTRQEKIPPGFCYCDYLQECLAQNVCNLMDINALSWIFLLLIAVCGLIVKAYKSRNWDNTDHLYACCAVVWGTLLCFLYLMWEVNTARSALRSHLDIKHSLVMLSKPMQTEPGAEEYQHHKHPDHPKDQAWAWRTMQLLQSFSLLTAFEGAFYVMHIDYNIGLNGFHWIWKFNILLPIIFNLCVMLPMVISRFTLVEAYYTPEHDAIDSVLTGMKQHEEDIRYMHQAWLHSGRPIFVDPGMHITFVEFSRVLKRHGMQSSRARQQRVFKKLDTDESGTIDVMKLLDELIALDDRELAHSQLSTPVTSARTPSRGNSQTWKDWPKE